jgi:nitroreductase
MEFDQVLAQRYSARRWTGQDISDDVLRTVLSAGLAMPHAGNTYAWQALVLRRPAQTHPRWAQIHAAMMEQAYLAEAPVLVFFTVRPRFWLDHQPGNVAAMAESGAMDPDRHGKLFEYLRTSVREPDQALTAVLMGEAMQAVGACVLAATSLGLGACLAAGHAPGLAEALQVPDGGFVCPTGIIALGYPADLDRPRAAKPDLDTLVCHGDWD